MGYLRRCIRATNTSRALVFMNYQRRLKEAEVRLQKKKIPCTTLHGQMGQWDRQHNFESFKRGDARVLVTTEIGARGLDVPECDTVINLEIPTDARHYCHRAGRAGRMGQQGLVITIVTPSEAFVISKFEKHIG